MIKKLERSLRNTSPVKKINMEFQMEAKLLQNGMPNLPPRKSLRNGVRFLQELLRNFSRIILISPGRNLTCTTEVAFQKLKKFTLPGT